MTVHRLAEKAEAAGPARTQDPRLKHKYAVSPNPRSAGSCVRCGRAESDPVHAYLEFAHRASVGAHLARASIAAGNGDLAEAVREALVAVRIAQEEA